MGFSFTQKVVMAILGMILLILGGIVFFFQLSSKRIAEEEIERRLDQAGIAFQNYQDEIRGKLFTVNYYIAGNSSFLAYMVEAIEAENVASLEDQFTEIQNFSLCDFMIVTDAEGIPVVDTTHRIADATQDQLRLFMRKVDEEGLSFAVFGAMGELYTVVMSPLVSGGFLHGYVLVGYRMTDTTAAEIGKVTNTDVLVLSDEDPERPHLVAGYFDDISRSLSDDDLIGPLTAAPENETFEFQAKGERYIGRMFQLLSVEETSVGRYVTVRSFDKEMEAFQEIRYGLLTIGALAVLLMIPLSIVAGRRVTRPVNHLVQAIENVQEGDYDEQRIKVESRDEIGIMAGAFKAMVKELRQQRELIEFLEESGGTREAQGNFDTTVQLYPGGVPQSPSASGQSVRKMVLSGKPLYNGYLLASRYEIIGILGKGGMGVVYRARDRTLDEVVAIKMLHVDNDSLADMLKHETKLARKVTHRNIVRIYDIGEVEGLQFISMEFVNGTTLKSLLKRAKRLPLSIGLRVGIQVCRGLEVAHEEGIVHGDIKPENIIINPRGEIKIMDFGVARVASLDAAGDSSVSGTPAYMPPEQFQGKPIDARSDIYSLGITMYELFAGRIPYSGKTLVELFKHHLASALPPLQERNPEVPAKLVAVIERAVAKKPEQRYPSASMMLQDLNNVA